MAQLTTVLELGPLGPEQVAVFKFHHFLTDRLIDTLTALGSMPEDYRQFAIVFCDVVSTARKEFESPSKFNLLFGLWAQYLAWGRTVEREYTTEQAARWYYAKFFLPKVKGAPTCYSEPFLHFDTQCRPLVQAETQGGRTCEDWRTWREWAPTPYDGGGGMADIGRFPAPPTTTTATARREEPIALLRG